MASSDERTECDHARIAELVRTGDERALERIAACYLDNLLMVGRCACRDNHGAQDAVQDALLIAAERLDQFRGDGTALGWLSAIVVNQCRCQQRGRKNNAGWNQPLANASGVASPENPEQHAIRAELARALTAAIGSLGARDQEMFIATQINGVSAVRLATQTGESAEAIRARLTRIRRKLRTHLATHAPH